MVLNIIALLMLVLLLFNKWIFLLAIGLFTSGVYIFDKYAACNRMRRIPELTLLTLAVLGGGIFALFTMLMIRHKTRKMQFFLPVLLIAIIQMIILARLVIEI